MTVFLFISGISVYGQNASENPNLESFNVTVNFGEIGSYAFPAFYEDPDGLYLPANTLMDLLKIVSNASPDGQVIKGYVETEQNYYEINFPHRFISFKEKNIQLADKDVLMDVGTLYIRKNALEQAFGFKIDFDFRSLSASFSSSFELPVVKLRKLEKAREKLNGKEEVIAYDTILSRDYHWFRGGMLDWSVASSQSREYPGETRVEVGGGTELLGGETNVWLNWSSEYGMNRKQQQYYWRWADNNATIVKQVQFGRVNSNSIASLLSPVDGFAISNTPTTVRKALGSYPIADHTDPNWVVELYINNVLMAYTKADASGFYTFSVPIVYGTSKITLRFYGPNGEVRSEEKNFTMPYNMMPKGEFEYRVSGGTVLDSTSSKYGRAEFSYGLTRWLTAGGGMEYLSSITARPEIPFANFTFQPFSRLLLTGEYAHKVRAKATMNYTLPANSTLELDYSRYTPGQKAIIYNYLEERSGNLSVPYRVRLLSGYAKAAIRQDIYSDFRYNSGEFMLSGNYRNYSLNLSNLLNWTGAGSSNFYANLDLSAKIGKDLVLRPSLQYNYTTGELISLKAELERRVSNHGQLVLRYENSMLSDYQSVNMTFRYDFSFMSAYCSSGYGNRQFQTSESANGSFAFGSGNKYVYADKSAAVGRCGISVEPFVDVNFNGKWDKGEPFIGDIKVRCNGGKVLENSKDSIVRIVGLEPFVDYTVILDESGFQNLTWHLPFKTVKVTTDPNQFKKIIIAIQPMGEVTGMVVKDDQAGSGIGRILVDIFNKDGVLLTKTLSESDGYFSYLGLAPGDYTACVDSLQQSILKLRSDPVPFTIHPNIQGDAVDIGNIVLHGESEQKEKTDTTGVTGSVEMLPVIYNESSMNDSICRFYVWFDHDRSAIRTEYIGTLHQLAQMMKRYDGFKIQIEGHTDQDGPYEYNQELSERRAEAVKSCLIRLGVDPDRLLAVGYGKKNPLFEISRKALNRVVAFKKAPIGTDLKIVNQNRLESLQFLERNRELLFIHNIGSDYFIQVGAFSTLQRAKKFADKVRAVFPDKTVLMKERSYYKVRVGYVESRDEALKLIPIIESSEILNA